MTTTFRQLPPTPQAAHGENHPFGEKSPIVVVVRSRVAIVKFLAPSKFFIMNCNKKGQPDDGSGRPL
jgi:hypothetical protein